MMYVTQALLTLSAAISLVTAQTSVSQSTFSNIIRYHTFAAASYAAPVDCKAPPYGSSIVQFINSTASDTQATLFRASDRNELVLSFRGTSTPPDLDVDLDFTLVPVSLSGISVSGGKVHRGFQSSYVSVGSSVTSALRRAQTLYPGSSLVVTGHSLGAGIAAVGAVSLVSTFPNLKVYTYGEPRNGNPAWASFVNSTVKNYFRVTHSNDGVPQIPPKLLGYQHHSTEYWLSQSGKSTAGTTFQCSGTDSNACNGAQNYGSSPINGAHIAYYGLTSTTLFNLGCGYGGPGL